MYVLVLLLPGLYPCQFWAVGITTATGTCQLTMFNEIYGINSKLTIMPFRAIPNDKKKSRFVIFLSWVVIFLVVIHDKIITNHDLIFFSFFPERYSSCR